MGLFLLHPMACVNGHKMLVVEGTAGGELPIMRRTRSIQRATRDTLGKW